MNIYLDVCSIHRPYDDMSIDRNRLEAEAVLIILRRIAEHRYSLVSSEMMDREIAANPDVEKVELVQAILGLAKSRVVPTGVDVIRARDLVTVGFRKIDALHLACAEAGRCAYFVTTDDQLIKRAKRQRRTMSVVVVNPVNFITEVDP